MDWLDVLGWLGTLVSMIFCLLALPRNRQEVKEHGLYLLAIIATFAAAGVLVLVVLAFIR